PRYCYATNRPLPRHPPHPPGGRSRSRPPPPAASRPSFLNLISSERGGHDAITIATLDMDVDMGVEATQMGAEPAAHGRLLWATGGGRRYISYDALRGTLCCAPGQGCPTTTAASAPPPTPTPAAASPSPTVARTTLPRL
uniref:Uncharacterized protein n=2 Tax=Triticum urartu TaxID=4572 RepID=A0A8R7P081_TRIUA